MDARAPCVIVVMGVSGCGKSTLAAALAARLRCAFLEGDAFHAPAAIEKMRAGRALDDADRWPWLDRLGAAVRATIGADGYAVLACSALKRSYRERLAAAAATPLRFVLLDVGRAELARRLAARPHHYMPACLLDSQLATLERPAADEGALTLDGGREPDALTDAVLAWAASAQSPALP